MSKRIFNHPPEVQTGRKYWRSLGQLDDTPEFRGWLEREFPQGASEMTSEVSRRSFLRLMGASTALAGLSMAACRRPEKHLVPFTKGVEWSIPGKPLFFATSAPRRDGHQPVVATTHDGRPTKIEGNPLHAVSKGATDLHAQASLLDLYDPDRAMGFAYAQSVKSEADFEKALDEALAKAGDGAGLALLLGRNSSPTRERLRAEIAKKFPAAIWAEYEPLDGDATAGLPAGVAAAADFAKADVIVALDADFLGEGDIAQQRAFSARRKVEDGVKMNRLYAVENRFTVTGGMADHRLRVRASEIAAFAAELAREVAAQSKDAALGGIAGALPAAAVKFADKWIAELAKDLVAHKGRAVVLAGERQPAAVKTLVLAINAALGALDATLVGRKTAKAAATIGDLAKAIDEKKVKTLFILGGNPAYDAPVDLDFVAKIKAVETTVRLSAMPDETWSVAGWRVPGTHYLEEWSDGRAVDGTYVSVQPMILPLFGGWSENDLLARIAGRPKPKGPELVQETFREVVKPGDFTAAWSRFLHDGFHTDGPAKNEALSFDATAAGAALKDAFKAAPAGDFEIVFAPCAKVGDGRYANNGWLQECPDPITKLTWDNAALISPASAKALGVKKDGEWLKLQLGERSLEVPALIAPGHADNSITLALGYGRTAAGRVGSVGGTTEDYGVAEVLGENLTSGGFNAYALRTTAAPYIATGAKVSKLDRKRYRLAVTQEHGSLEGRGADILREQTLDQYTHDPKGAKTQGMDAHIPANHSLYANPELTDKHQWAMVVDLSACTGCSACMVACQAENNIPVVGKRQVIDGREMHWIRTDRYFASGPDARGEYDKQMDDPELVSQPMMCQQCEKAPCETVCPVNATVHSDDGINTMAYNRCIGTRYCANNCPFKVRRFNFFDYNQRKLTDLRRWNLVNEKGTEDTIKMSKNPNVTVRMRGVMEKCTFCVQRVQEAKIASKVGAQQSEARVPADAFTSACAQVCPSDAIVFGDKNNPDSRLAKLLERERGYRLFEYLNLSTRVTYLARIKNPNPAMPGPKPAEYIKQHHHAAPVEAKNA